MPVTCLVVALMRFQALIVTMAMIRAARLNPVEALRYE
jgi:ABC-type lipoprotein release transport system permease subunit